MVEEAIEVGGKDLANFLDTLVDSHPVPMSKPVVPPKPTGLKLFPKPNPRVSSSPESKGHIHFQLEGSLWFDKDMKNILMKTKTSEDKHN